MRRKYSLSLIFILMFMVAYLENARGVFLPSFRDAFEVDSVAISFMITLSTFGYLLATLFSDLVSERIGTKGVMLVAILLMALTSFTISTVSTYTPFLVVMFIMNVALGLNNYGMNLTVPLMALGNLSVIMNSLHFMYAAGATVSQRANGLLITSGNHYQSIYRVLGALFLIGFVALLFTRLPSKDQETFSRRDLVKFVKNRRYWFYVMCFAGYVFSEVSIGTWFVDYAKFSFATPESDASLWVSLFFILLALGRLTGGHVVKRFGEIKTLTLSLCIGMLLVLTSFLLGTRAFFLMSAAGLFYSIGFPTLVVSLGVDFSHLRSKSFGIVLASGSIGNMMLTQLMGFLIPLVGYRIAILMIPVGLLLCILGLLGIRSERAKENVI